MTWHDDPKHPFAGIAEKLKRADQNIANLNGEIASFFEGGKYPVVPNEDSKEWQEAVDYHSNLPIPIRFSVLCGEIVHHMRSSLDHIAWHFSSGSYRRDHENLIEFPILQQPFPSGPKDKSRVYDRKIKGITNPNVLRMIGDLQPHVRGDDAIDHPLCIVHDMDRFDKHRELTIIASCVNLVIPGAAISEVIAAIRHRQGEPLSPEEQAAAERTLQTNMKFFPQVAFVQFGKRKTQPIVPALQQLQKAIDTVVGSFANEI